MIKHNQDGAVNGLVISLVLAVLLLIGAISFGGWAFSSRQDYKNNTDAKAAAAAEVAVEAANKKKDKEFAEDYKKPFNVYKGPEAYGSIQVTFPKTWSGYVDSDGNSPILDGYFAPNVVPSISDDANTFALRVQIVSESYTDVLNSFSSQQRDGRMKVEAYALPKLPKIVGVKATGQLSENQKVVMVVLPLRSETLKIWTEGDQHVNDFNNYILPNFTFSP
jgi:hypothetical protein